MHSTELDNMAIDAFAREHDTGDESLCLVVDDEGFPVLTEEQMDDLLVTAGLPPETADHIAAHGEYIDDLLTAVA